MHMLLDLLGSGSLSFGGGSLDSLLGAAATGALLRLLRGGEGGLVEVHELDEHHLGGVTGTEVRKSSEVAFLSFR